MIFLLMVLLFVPVVIMTACIPYVTRKTESFGVSIPEDIYLSDELKRIRKSYAVVTVLAGLVFAAAALILAMVLSEQGGAIALTAMFLLFLAASFIIYLKFHYRMKALKAERNWQQHQTETVVADLRFREHKLTVSNGWFLLPFLLFVATAAMTFIWYDRIPEQIPMQYDFEGNVTNWTEKSYRALMMMPVMQLFMIGLFLFLNTVVVRSRQQIDAGSPQKSIKQNVAFRYRWSVFLLLTGIALVFLFFFIQLSFIIEMGMVWMATVPIILTFAILIGAIWLAFVTGQGGSRIKVSEDKQEKVINRDEDRYWKLGVFYVNRGDPSIWVEKRFGVGWTVNWAHPLSWGILILILAIAFLLPLLLQ